MVTWKEDVPALPGVAANTPGAGLRPAGEALPPPSPFLGTGGGPAYRGGCGSEVIST
jgi:hypothetical protein